MSNTSLHMPGKKGRTVHHRKQGRRMRWYGFFKRICDIFFCSFALIVLSPVFLIAVIGIRMSSRGPIFYTSVRAGKNKRPFSLYKFRSMHLSTGADKEWFVADQNRLFPFGALMRRLKIDELPQLINVIAGSLSVIQRPITVTFNEGYNSSPYGLTVAEINNRINLLDAFAVASGVEGLTAFAGEHSSVDVFYLSIDVESEQSGVPDFGDYTIDVQFNPNYEVTLTATEEDGRVMYHVYAATLSAGLDLTGMKPIYDGQSKSVRVTFYNSNDEVIEAPVKYHIEYRFNSGEDWIPLDNEHSIIHAGSYSVRVIVDGTDNYVVSLTQGSFNISPANFQRYDLTVGDAPEYDGDPKAMSVTWLFLC